MQNSDIIFWAALGFCGFALICFAVLSVIQLRNDTREGAGGVQTEGEEALSGVLETLASLTAAFGKAGPISTAATLAIFFMIVALIASGLISVGS